MNPASLSDLRAWSSAVLDTRRGAERRDVRPARLSDAALDALTAAAEPLGLVRTAERTRGAYDTTVILAGATTGNRLRTHLAATVLAGIQTRTLVGLASSRPISPSEVADDPDSADDGTEWRNLLRYVDEALGPLTHLHTDHADDWYDLSRVTPNGLPVRLLVAPPDGHRRPTTTSQLRFLRDRVPLDHRRSALLITSAIYVPYQFFAGAPEVVSDGATWAEFVGTPTAMSGDRHRLGQRLAQETHAAIDAALTLVGAV